MSSSALAEMELPLKAGPQVRLPSNGMLYVFIAAFAVLAPAAANAGVVIAILEELTCSIGPIGVHGMAKDDSPPLPPPTADGDEGLLGSNSAYFDSLALGVVTGVTPGTRERSIA